MRNEFTSRSRELYTQDRRAADTVEFNLTPADQPAVKRIRVFTRTGKKIFLKSIESKEST